MAASRIIATVAALLAGTAGLADAMALAARARAGDLDAAARVPCAQEAGEALGECEAGVARGDPGAAAVAVTFANGFTRVLHFEDGGFVRGSATMSGVGTDVDWRLEGGTFHVRVDDQRFVLPAAFVFGVTDSKG